MNHAIRSVRANTPTVLLSPLASRLGQKAASVNTRQVTTLANKPGNSQKMETNEKMDPNNSEEKTGGVMSDSYGEGYATRSDEEGFGGIHGGNQTIPSVEIDKQIHDKHPAYDKTQGSEVTEKEKGRHQTNASN